MKLLWIILTVALVGLIVGLIAWLGGMPSGPLDSGRLAAPPAPAAASPLRIGVVPERDIFTLRKRYLVLADYLSHKFNRPVEVVMTNTYQAVLQDFSEQKVDAAFLGSLVAVLVMDRLKAQVLVKPVDENGVSTYRGVIIVKDDSPVKRVEDLKGRSIAMVWTTTAGELFPIERMLQAGLLDKGSAPRFAWVGTHDDVILEMLGGRVDAGAVKNLRLDAYQAAHPDVKLRRLAEGEELPNNALVLRADLVPQLGETLKQTMLGMDKDPDGAKTLAAFGARRFVPCTLDEFKPIYTMIDNLGAHWILMAIGGPPPKWPEPDAKP